MYDLSLEQLQFAVWAVLVEHAHDAAILETEASACEGGCQRVAADRKSKVARRQETTQSALTIAFTISFCSERRLNVWQTDVLRCCLILIRDLQVDETQPHQTLIYYD